MRVNAALSHEYIGSEFCKTGHIVPHWIGFKNTGHLFGNSENGYAFLWDIRNRLPMKADLEGIFNKDRIPVRPVSAKLEEVIDYKIVIIDESVRSMNLGNGVTVGDLDEKPLVFRNANCPDNKYVYWHFATSLRRHLALQSPGYAGKILALLIGTASGKTGNW